MHFIVAAVVGLFAMLIVAVSLLLRAAILVALIWLVWQGLKWTGIIG